MIASLIRTIFSQPDAEYVHHQHAEVVRMLERIHPKTADLLADAKEDLLAFTGVPKRPLAANLVDQPVRAAQPGN